MGRGILLAVSYHTEACLVARGPLVLPLGELEAAVWTTWPTQVACTSLKCPHSTLATTTWSPWQTPATRTFEVWRMTSSPCRSSMEKWRETSVRCGQTFITCIGRRNIWRGWEPFVWIIDYDHGVTNGNRITKTRFVRILRCLSTTSLFAIISCLFWIMCDFLIFLKTSRRLKTSSPF